MFNKQINRLKPFFVCVFVKLYNLTFRPSFGVVKLNIFSKSSTATLQSNTDRITSYCSRKREI